jgi:amidophosphoribosyltransferase
MGTFLAEVCPHEKTEKKELVYMCGIFGIQNHKEAVQLTFLGLYGLQHRGEESAGIASYGKDGVCVHRGEGSVEKVFKEKVLNEMTGQTAIGHVRYSTTGSSSPKNIQPFSVNHRGQFMAVAHNGNLTNTRELSDLLEKSGSIFQSSMDSEILIHLLTKSGKEDIKDKFIDALSAAKGAYSALFLVDGLLVGARDPYGIKPLSLGKVNGSYILASETCVFDMLGAEYIRDIKRGEIIFIDKDNNIESVFMKKALRSDCIFELIYFGRPDSKIFGDSVYLQRKRLGKQLAIEHPCEADLVLPVPDSGSFAALGFAEETGIPFELGIVRNHYIGRTFTNPSQFIREFKVKIKLNPIKELLKGKNIVLVDDSIVRGTTSKNRIQTLRDAGVKKIHMRISCPPIISPCFYGIDFPTKKELIANNKTIKEIKDFIGVDSLGYVSLDGMKQALAGDKQRFCDACFSGNYPIDVSFKSSKYMLEMNKQSF